MLRLLIGFYEILDNRIEILLRRVKWLCGDIRDELQIRVVNAELGQQAGH